MGQETCEHCRHTNTRSRQDTGQVPCKPEERLTVPCKLEERLTVTCKPEERLTVPC